MTISTSKWREPIVDPLELDLGSDLVLKDIAGYPHAGNDVFLCNGLFQNQSIEFYLKIARHKDANLSNEAAALAYLNSTPIPVPRVLSHGFHNKTRHEFLAISTMPGKRMSGTLSEPHWRLAKANVEPYLFKMAENLFRVHDLAIDWLPVRPRTQFLIPVADRENPSLVWLQEKIDWLTKNKPSKIEKCFVHGDHHYANLLWLDGKISAVLDWELCGIGWREFDIAWSMLPRPGQQFLTTMVEQNVFLEAYKQMYSYDVFSVIWCFILIAVHFLSVKPVWDDKEYHSVLKNLSHEYLENM